MHKSSSRNHRLGALSGASVFLCAFFADVACAEQPMETVQNAGSGNFLLALLLAALLGFSIWALVTNSRLRETNDRLQQNERILEYKTNFDELTGLYSKRHFYEGVRELLDKFPNVDFAIVRWDLSRFKVFNDLYGVAAGDKLLHDVGEEQIKHTGERTLCGRLEGDHFVFCLPADTLDIQRIYHYMNDWFKRYDSRFEFVCNIGVYVITDRDASVSLMCDRALLALRSVKENYHKHYAYYDDGMRDRLIVEQQTVADMRVAIEQEQFILYFQPQFNFETGEIFGAEALVRWQHPTRGMIPPNEFIPAFEKSGFITEMDRYIWRLTCRYIRKWMDAGGKFVPITVSVNVSRIDIYNPMLISDVIAIVEEYGVPVSMLKLEITESAYVENPKQLIEMVKAFKRRGFTVEMDDFGSGYSSLNTLKDVPVDVLKLDLKFLSGDQHTGRGGNILSSVIRMARWLDMPVIAEGVETVEQAQYLKSIGCVLMQGYYFARPMSVDEFETFIQAGNTGLMRSPDDDSFQDFDELWDPRSPSAKLFTGFIGGAAILEYANENLEAIRINDKCFRIFGLTRESYTRNGLQMLKRINEDDLPAFMGSLKAAVETRKESQCDVRTRNVGDSGVSWVRTRLQLIAKADKSCLFFVAIEDISEQKRLSLALEQTNQQMQLMMQTMPGGVFRYAADENETLGYISPSLLNMLGYDEADLRTRCGNCFSNLIFEADKTRVRTEIEEQVRRGDNAQCEFRTVTGGGDIRWVYAVSRMEHDETGKLWFNVIVTDIDREKRMREMMLEERERYHIIVEESGAALFEWNYQSGSFYHSPSFDQLFISLLDAKAVFGGEFAIAEVVHPQDVETFSIFLNQAKHSEGTTRCTIRVRMVDKSYKWAHITLAILRDDHGERQHAIGAISIIDEIKRIEQTQRWQEERYRILMEDLNVATVDYDPAANVMTRLVNVVNQGVKEKVICDYTTRVHHSSVVHPDSVPVILGALENACKAPTSGCVEYTARYGGGDYHWVRAHYVSLADENGNVYRFIAKIDDIQDIKEIEKSASQIKESANADAVTGLLTRAAFERAATAYLQSERGNISGALIMLDVDNFKKTNDTFGHIVGDKVLHSFAEKTRDSFRREDIMGRLGGDEFMVLITSSINEEMLRDRLERLLVSLREAKLPDGRNVTGSIGAVLVKPNDKDFLTLYQQVDNALYQAKKAGKDCYSIKED